MTSPVTIVTFIALDKLQAEHPEYAAGLALHAIDPTWPLSGDMRNYLLSIGILMQGEMQVHELIREAILRYDWAAQPKEKEQ